MTFQLSIRCSLNEDFNKFQLTKKAFLSSFSNGSSLILVCLLGCSDWFGVWFFGFIWLFGLPPTPNVCLLVFILGFLFYPEGVFLVIWGKNSYG